MSGQFGYNLASFRLARLLANILPRPVTQSIAGCLGRASYLFNKKSREALRENLRLVTGLEGGDFDYLCRDNFANFTKMLADYFYCTGGTGERAGGLFHRRLDGEQCPLRLGVVHET